jgi:hypothetical protein
MKRPITASLAAFGLVAGALGCAGNSAKVDEGTASATDTTPAPPPGYSGMERDTTQPQPAQTPTDTFLQRQGTGAPQDTMGYSGLERVDTTGQQHGQNDTTAMPGMDSTAAGRMDSTGMSGGAMDSTGTNR